MAAISRGLTTPNLPPGVTLQRQARSVGKVPCIVTSRAECATSMQMKLHITQRFLKCSTVVLQLHKCRTSSGFSWIYRAREQPNND